VRCELAQRTKSLRRAWPFGGWDVLCLGGPNVHSTVMFGIKPNSFRVLAPLVRYKVQIQVWLSQHEGS